MYAIREESRYERRGEVQSFAQLMPQVLRQHGLNDADRDEADEPLPFADQWLGASLELAVA